MVSQILWADNIPNSILVYKPHVDHLQAGGHVVVEVRPENSPHYILDADFGVVFPNAKMTTEARHTMINGKFLDAGYSERRANMLADIMTGRFVEWKNTWSIMKKRYAFEMTTYLLKWLVPFLLLGIFLCSRVRRAFIEFD